MTTSTSRLMRFAWFEYEDAQDGIIFHRAFTAQGWSNLLLDLAPVTPAPRRMDLGQQDLEIRWAVNKQNTKETGLIAMPDTSHGDFLGKWMLNPGVKQFRLTTDSDADDQADLVVVSGHGYSGIVTGLGLHNGQDHASIDLTTTMNKSINLATTGKMKYLIIAACNNVAKFNDSFWAALLQKVTPIHGILGYEKAYPGNNTGAAIMASFSQNLHKNGGSGTVLGAWKAANVGQNWGAFVLEAAAKSDTLSQWRTAEGLKTPPIGSKILHFSSKTPDGIEISINKSRAFDVLFQMADGTAITRANINQPSIGLFPGKRGSLLVRRNDGRLFRSGETVRIVFTRYRFDRRDMNLQTLLKFDASPGLTPILDGNTQKGSPPASAVDSIDFTFAQSGNEVTLPFTVLANAHQSYSGELGDHGYFLVLFFPPSTATNNPDNGIIMGPDGALLRAPGP